MIRIKAPFVEENSLAAQVLLDPSDPSPERIAWCGRSSASVSRHLERFRRDWQALSAPTVPLTHPAAPALAVRYIAQCFILFFMDHGGEDCYGM